MEKALIYLDGQDMKRSAELLEVIHRIYGEKAVQTYAVIFGDASAAETKMFDVVHCFKADDNQRCQVRWMASCIKTLHDTEQFSGIIIPATSQGRMIAPVLAMKLATGLVADVTDVSVDEGIVQMVRPAFDGKLMARIVNQDTSLVVMSVRLGAFQCRKKITRKTKLVIHEKELGINTGIRLLEKSKKAVSEDIRDARILVSGGGGVENHFPRLQELAELLHAMPASSRRLVDGGITPRRIQVGQSGKTVSPELYIALGIYGSMQHMEGLKHVDYIISVNTNRNAPICSLSTIVVEGDAAEFIERLSNKIIETKTIKTKIKES